MAAPKTIKTAAGVPLTAAALSVENPAVPLNPAVLQQQILQLQNTVNELITRHNQLCTDTAHAGDAVTGAGTAATSLFTAS